jgi:uncharacterized protein (DUF952 family)
MPSPSTIFRLLAADVWERALESGRFEGTDHDLRDGFIHFSTAEQVVETARRHYSGQPNLILLWVSTAALGSALRWEPSRGGALFPHLYAALLPSAVTKTAQLPLGPDGGHVFSEIDLGN